jgi:hypothetical protein
MKTKFKATLDAGNWIEIMGVSHLSYLSFVNQGPSIKSSISQPGPHRPLDKTLVLMRAIFHLIRAINHNMALTARSTKPWF